MNSNSPVVSDIPVRIDTTNLVRAINKLRLVLQHPVAHCPGNGLEICIEFPDPDQVTDAMIEDSLAPRVQWTNEADTTSRPQEYSWRISLPLKVVATSEDAVSAA